MNTSANDSDYLSGNNTLWKVGVSALGGAAAPAAVALSCAALYAAAALAGSSDIVTSTFDYGTATKFAMWFAGPVSVMAAVAGIANAGLASVKAFFIHESDALEASANKIANSLYGATVGVAGIAASAVIYGVVIGACAAIEHYTHARPGALASIAEAAPLIVSSLASGVSLMGAGLISIGAGSRRSDFHEQTVVDIASKLKAFRGDSSPEPSPQSKTPTASPT